MRKQRIYRGGTQFHEHYEMPHAGPMLHDGYWRHYHDKEGMMAVEEEEEGDRTPQDTDVLVTIRLSPEDFDRLCENSGDLRQAFPALYERFRDGADQAVMRCEWRHIYWMGDDYTRLLLARSFLDAIGEPCQIAVDEGADDQGRANGWVILTDYASPVWAKNSNEEK